MMKNFPLDIQSSLPVLGHLHYKSSAQTIIDNIPHAHINADAEPSLALILTASIVFQHQPALEAINTLLNHKTQQQLKLLFQKRPHLGHWENRPEYNTRKVYGNNNARIVDLSSQSMNTHEAIDWIEGQLISIRKPYNDLSFQRAQWQKLPCHSKAVAELITVAIALGAWSELKTLIRGNQSLQSICTQACLFISTVAPDCLQEATDQQLMSDSDINKHLGAQDNNGTNLGQLALACNQETLVQRLLIHQPDLVKTNHLILEACNSLCSLSSFQRILDQTENFNPIMEESTPIGLLIRHCQTEQACQKIEALLKIKPALIWDYCFHCLTPFMMCAWMGRTQALDCLIKASGSQALLHLNRKNDLGYDTLHYAIIYQHHDCATTLLRLGTTLTHPQPSKQAFTQLLMHTAYEFAMQMITTCEQLKIDWLPHFTEACLSIEPSALKTMDVRNSLICYRFLRHISDQNPPYSREHLMTFFPMDKHQNLQLESLVIFSDAINLPTCAYTQELPGQPVMSTEGQTFHQPSRWKHLRQKPKVINPITNETTIDPNNDLEGLFFINFSLLRLCLNLINQQVNQKIGLLPTIIEPSRLVGLTSITTPSIKKTSLQPTIRLTPEKIIELCSHETIETLFNAYLNVNSRDQTNNCRFANAQSFEHYLLSHFPSLTCPLSGRYLFNPITCFLSGISVQADHTWIDCLKHPLTFLQYYFGIKAMSDQPHHAHVHSPWATHLPLWKTSLTQFPRTTTNRALRDMGKLLAIGALIVNDPESKPVEQSFEKTIETLQNQIHTQNNAQSQPGILSQLYGWFSGNRQPLWSIKHSIHSKQI